jgi:hypothetical protein
MSQYAKIRDLFWPNGPRPDVWAVLDGARDPKVLSAILGSHNLSACLYAGAISDALEQCAPHLVQLDYDDTLTKHLLESVWDQSWGIFLRCDTSLEQLRRHLRRSLIVQDAGSRRLVFRYYDPRVLRVFLPTCLPDELDHIYGPIDRFWTSGDDPAEVLIFLRKNRALSVERIAGML